MDDIKNPIGGTTPAAGDKPTDDTATGTPPTPTLPTDTPTDTPVPATDIPVTSEPPAKKPADVKDVELPGEGEEKTGTEAAMPETQAKPVV